MNDPKNLPLPMHQDKLLAMKQKMREELPHLYSYKLYKWSREFFESTNKLTFLTAANQIGKSSIQIRKVIHWATAPKLWPTLWKVQPRQMWYLYPTMDLAEAELKNKWIPEFLPRGDMQNDPQYGWKLVNRMGRTSHIQFNTGVNLYYKTYAQNVQYLQAGTCSYIATDEELPEDIFSELMFRLAATDGYFSMVFTATIGQDIWRRAMERIGFEDEMFPQAKKIQVSMYDCLEYEDGTPTPWNKQRIADIKASCKSEQEIQRRVYGKFVKDSGLKYPCFNRSIHAVPAKDIPEGWYIYSGVDIGSGGKNHKPAVAFVAVAPDMQQGIIFRGWRGTSSEVYTSSDILMKYRMIRGNLKCTAQYYDWACKDFHTYASRLGEPFSKADKDHALGEELLNTLFKNNMLEIYDLPELQDLMVELETLDSEKYQGAQDDFIDALRYAVTKIPWDFSHVSENLNNPKKSVKKEKSELQLRRERFFSEEFEESERDRVGELIDGYNELFEY